MNDITKRGWGNLCVAIIFFSTYEVATKYISGMVDIYFVNYFRFLLGGLILVGYMFFRKVDMKVSIRDIGWLTLLGFINVCISMNLLQKSLIVENANAAVSALIFSCNPIFVVILAGIFYKEKINRKLIFGLSIAFLGIVIIMVEKASKGTDVEGAFWALASSMTFALFTVLGRKIAVRMGSVKMNAYSFIAGSLLMMPIILYSKSWTTLTNPNCIPGVLYLAIFVTGIGYITYFNGISLLGAARGSITFLTKPVLATLLAYLFLREDLLNYGFIAGGFLIISGIGISVLKKSNSKV